LLFAATALAAGMSVGVTPSAFADGVADCSAQAKDAGLKVDQAATACGYAQAGDTEDCASMVRNDSTTVSDEGATAACGAAAPAPAPAGG
jgi:hypothetical protein